MAFRSYRKGSVAEMIHDWGWVILVIIGISIGIFLVWKTMTAGEPILDKIPGIMKCKQALFSLECLQALWPF